MLVTHSLPGRTIRVEGKELLYFSGTSYLGMGHNEFFRQQVLEGMVQYGSNYSSSRSSNLQLAVFEEAENWLAHFTGAEAALTFSSGYLAGQAAIHALRQSDIFLYAPGTHPALWRDSQDGYTGTFTEWASQLPETIEQCKNQNIVIACNSLDPLYAEKYSFDWLADLPTDQSITIVVDDSHGLGIMGRNGAGIFPELMAKSTHHNLIVVSSLGKAFGVPGGVVLGNKEFINNLWKSPYFAAGSPIPPVYLYAFLQSDSIYQEARAKLTTNILNFKQSLIHLNLFKHFDNYPVFYTKENSLYEALKPQCILSSFPYPDPSGKPITRVVLNSLHQQADIELLADLINKYSQQI